jgi:sphingolipid 4-desaturase/C4-monooxygenase
MTFIWSNTEEPHKTRKIKILKSHPEIIKLQGPEWKSKWIVIVLVILQIWLSIKTIDMSRSLYCFVVYVFGATITQSLFLAIHELSHNLFFVNFKYNHYFACFANLPIGIPFAIAFRSYHLEHHKYQGVDGIDTDIPSELECKFVHGKFKKSIWLAFQIVAYALRPCLLRSQRIKKTHILNASIQLLFNYCIIHVWGWQPFIYYITCVFVSGLHPCAGHFISEHYVFPHKSDTQETYSYYGILNSVCWNVGYHNEHHDFPYVSWSRLPQVHKIAHEHYDSLKVCTSWIGVLYDYIMYDNVGPSSRVKRKMF